MQTKTLAFLLVLCALTFAVFAHTTTSPPSPEPTATITALATPNDGASLAITNPAVIGSPLIYNMNVAAPTCSICTKTTKKPTGANSLAKNPDESAVFTPPTVATAGTIETARVISETSANMIAATSPAPTTRLARDGIRHGAQLGAVTSHSGEEYTLFPTPTAA